MGELYRILIGSKRGYYAFKEVPNYASPDSVFVWNMSISEVRITEPLSAFFEWYLRLNPEQIGELFFNEKITIGRKDHRGLMLAEIRT